MKLIALAAVGLLFLIFILLMVIRFTEAGRVNAAWRSLEVSAETPADIFSREMLDGLPEVAQRYLLHAIAPDTPLARHVLLSMEGEIQPQSEGPWLPFRAKQIITPGKGFIWKAAARQGWLSLQVTDSYVAAKGRTRVALLGLLPIVNASNPDVTQSAAGRLLSEYVLLPSALLPQFGVVWEAVDSIHAKVTVAVDDYRATLHLTIDREGALKGVLLRRWSDTAREYVPFGVIVQGEKSFGGYTIPAKLTAGWGYGTDSYREFFRAEILQAVFGY